VNSPPGIQTIPSCAGLGAGEEFATVATKPDDGDGAAICCAEAFKPNDALSVSVTKRILFVFGRSAEIESLLAFEALCRRRAFFESANFVVLSWSLSLSGQT
jgi:hypothetical protein